jgi:hypothetical protein
VRRAALLVAGVFASACGLLVGIGTELGVRPIDDGGETDTAGADVVIREDAPSDLDASFPPPRRPPEGTYYYDIDGSDQVTGFLNHTSPYGPGRATVTIAYVDSGGGEGGANCFDQTFVFRQYYTETMRFCVLGVELVEDASTRIQEFTGAVHASSTTTETCTPSDVYLSTAAKPGDSWPRHCTGQTADSVTGTSTYYINGTYTYVGDETFPVMGRDAGARHFHDVRDAGGQQTGTNNADWYFSMDDATLVRFNRTIDVSYDWGIGHIRYFETVDLRLAQLPGATDAGGD